MKPEKMTEERMKELRAYFRGQGPVERHGKELLGHIAALEAEREEVRAEATRALNDARRLIRERDGYCEERDALRERAQALEASRNSEYEAARDERDEALSILAAIRQRAGDVCGLDAAFTVADGHNAALLAVARYIVGADDHGECRGCAKCWPVPQTDDLAAVEQYHENQDAKALGGESVAATCAVPIECRHGFDACPECDGSPAPHGDDALEEADDPIDDPPEECKQTVKCDPQTPGAYECGKHCSCRCHAAAPLEPTTAEAFATVHDGLKVLEHRSSGFADNKALRDARSAFALLELRMGAMARAIHAVLAEFDDARLSDLFSTEADAIRGLRAALTDAPPVFTPDVPIELATLIEGFAAEVQAAEDHARRPKGGQQVTPCGEFVRCTPSMLGRLRWWANALKAGRTTTPVFTLEEVENALRAAYGPLAMTTTVREKLTGLRRTP